MLTSSAGDWAARLALAVLVLDRTGSPALSALVIGISFLPWIGPGQLLATRIGHLRRVPVLVTADLARAVIYAVLLVHLPVAGVLVLTLLAAFFAPPFDTARSSLTVEVVPEEEYGPAIALLDLTDQSAIVIGYLVGGAVIALGGYRLALGVDVASYLVSALAISRIRETRQATRREPSGAQLGRGLRTIWSDRVIRRALTVIVLTGLGLSAVEATAAAYSRLVLHSGAATAGLLAAAVPVGVIVAVPLLPRSGSARRLLRAAGAVQVVGGLIGVVAFGAGHLAGAVIGFFGAGVLTGSVTPAQVAFQPRIPGGDRPSVFAVAQGLAVGIQGLGAVLGGVLAGLVDPRNGALVWASFVVVAALVLLAVPSAHLGDDVPPTALAQD